MTTATEPLTLEQEVEAASNTTQVPIPEAQVSAPPAAESTEISARKAGSIRKQQEDQARQSQLIADGVAIALSKLGFQSPQQQFTQQAPAPASPALPDYLDGIEPAARAEWGETLKLTARVGQNAEDRAVARAVAQTEAKYGAKLAELEATMNRNHSALRSGVASSFSAADPAIQRVQDMEGWGDYLSGEDESGMVRNSAVQYWQSTDPTRAAKTLRTYATNFLAANKQTIPSGFSHMATPTQAAGGSGVTELRKTVSAGAINKLIAAEIAKPNGSPERLGQLRDMFNAHAAAKTLVA